MRDQMIHAGDWSQVGYEDGTIGLHPVAHTDLHGLDQEVITPEQYEEYKAGYRRGNREFCTPSVARYQGELGNTYDNQCSWSEDETDLIAEWDEGYEEYEEEELND